MKDLPVSSHNGRHLADHRLSKVLRVDDMKSPGHVSFSKDGCTWAVTDSSSHCVHLFDDEDRLVKTVGTIGSANGEFKNPKGVAFDGNNHLYVVDGNNHRIQKFDTTGDYLLQFGCKLNNGKLNSPTGIAVHDDKIYVADSGNSIISVFKVSGEYCFSFGSEEFAGLLDVTINADNHVLVSTWSSEGVHKFTLDGQCIGKFGQRGYYKAPLSFPYCLATNSSGHTLVAEYYNHRVSVFDKDGAFVSSFGSKGSGTGQFSYIEGIALNSDGKIYISDNGNHRIQVYT